ncbi:MAG: hypothetical protein ACE5G5_11020 [Candidatus Methylomirabilales bacterium]
MNSLSALLVATTVVSAACSGGSPVRIRIAGIVTGKHQMTQKGNPSVSEGKEKPRYFLWVKTENGTVFTEVSGEMFQSVAKGDQVCINCNSTGP